MRLFIAEILITERSFFAVGVGLFVCFCSCLLTMSLVGLIRSRNSYFVFHTASIIDMNVVPLFVLLGMFFWCPNLDLKILTIFIFCMLSFPITSYILVKSIKQIEVRNRFETLHNVSLDLKKSKR